jgi:HlyD family secretion protein
MKRRNIGLGVGLVVAVAFALVWAFQPRPLPVEVATVARGPFEKTIDDDGRTRVRQRYVIDAPLAGRLARVTLNAGDAVRAGEPVARIAPLAPALLDARTRRELQERVGAAEALLAQARAEVARSEAALAQARLDLERQGALQGAGFLSPAVRVQARTRDAALAAQHAADHTLAQARAAAAQAAGEGGRALPVMSPVNGQVLRLMQQSETAVALGTPLMEVGDTGDLEVVVDLLSSDAARLAPGARVHLDAGGTTRPGRLRRIEPAAFTKVSALGVEEQRVNAIIDFDPAADGKTVPQLGDGFRVDARIVELSQADALLVPVAALFRAGSGEAAGWAVFVLAGGRTEQRAVTLGPRGPLKAVVTAGLEAGERVVIYPGDALSNGRRVSVVLRPE